MEKTDDSFEKPPNPTVAFDRPNNDQKAVNFEAVTRKTSEVVASQVKNHVIKVDDDFGTSSSSYS